MKMCLKDDCLTHKSGLELLLVLLALLVASTGHAQGLVYSCDFEGTNWVMFEEIVGGSSYYTNGIGEVSNVPDHAYSGSRGLRVWANKAHSNKSNHVISAYKAYTNGQTGVFCYSSYAFIDTGSAHTAQTGPECGLASTRELSNGVWRTMEAGLQHWTTKHMGYGNWAIWDETSPGVAQWVVFTNYPLASGVWYRIVFQVDFTENRYIDAFIEGNGQTVYWDLSEYEVAQQVKYSEGAFWLSLEGENMFIGDSTNTWDFKMYYDDVMFSRPCEATVSATVSDPTCSSAIPVTVTFSEPVTGLTPGSIATTNAVVTSLFTNSASTYTVMLEPADQGVCGFGIPRTSTRGLPGNGNVATQFSITYDGISPSVSISSESGGQTCVSPVPVSVVFSEDVTGFQSADLVVTNGEVDNFSGSGSNYCFDVVPTHVGAVSVDIPADVAVDSAGNGNTVATGFSTVYILDAPTNVAASDGVYTDRIAITWNAVTGATGYVVYRGASSSSASASILNSTSDAELQDFLADSGMTCYYWIRATNACLESELSACDSGYRDADDDDDEDDDDTVLESSPVYRLYSYGAEESTFEHLWTMNEAEKDTLDSWPSWQYEGVAWYGLTSQVSDAVPLFRLYAPSIRQHHYTIDTNEYAVNADNGTWNGEGIQYYVYAERVSNTTAAYRFYHSGLYLHHFTISENERDTITNSPAWGYEYEGIGFYVFATNGESSILESLKKAHLSAVVPQARGTKEENTRTKEQHRRRCSLLKKQSNTADRTWPNEPADADRLESEHLSILFTVDCQLSTDLIEVPGDYNGDGIEDAAYYEELSGQWLIILYSNLDVRCSSSSPYSLRLAPQSSSGVGGPVVYSLPRDSSSLYGLESTVYSLTWGGPGLLPASCDYDEDGTSDLAVYDQKSGLWFICSLDERILLWESPR